MQKKFKEKIVYNHELIFHINDGSDGSLEFIKKNGYKFTYSDKNMGLCSSNNQASNYII